MEREGLRRILNKFTADDLHKALARWDFLTKDEIASLSTEGKRIPKQDAIKDILELCDPEELSSEDIAKLDLIHIQQHSQQRLWSAYELQEGKDLVSNPKVLQKKLSEELLLYFKSDVCVMPYSGAIWIRVYMEDLSRASRRSTSLSDTVYLVYCPQTLYLISTKVKATFAEYLHESLCTSLNCQSLKDMMLTGKSVASLLDIVLNRACQGAFWHYQENKENINPLAPGKKPKRKVEEIEHDDQIQREDYRKKRKTLARIENIFGPFVQPALQTLEFKLETRFRGFRGPRHLVDRNNMSAVESSFPLLERKYEQSIGNTNKPFNCRVKFEGSNVLEGIRQLAEAGLATLPLPKILTCVPSEAKNHLIIADKKRGQSDIRSPRA